MPRLIPTAHRHHQVTSSSTWTITHNMSGSGSSGIPIVDVMVVDPADGVTWKKIMPLQATITDANTLTLTFSEAFAGYAVVVG